MILNDFQATYIISSLKAGNRLDKVKKVTTSVYQDEKIHRQFYYEVRIACKDDVTFRTLISFKRKYACGDITKDINYLIWKELQ